ncbi:tRNA (N6-isopentenyl adenosine(37)-C2)-methylthiotransferase MiaB [Xanthocytophaga agilis]|uniref:tRNA-2-methylthio-N(6)-dimethylallyladenosine synthase n=1 Tax=Xanthocytophaga agilis TaxID=3048010 RepID=A0AAE3QXH0_9BACT|nr:tRNA (N6-isopentenyl adenosine(37)-C2)-methylthiotransferase MiaB [Xanthocytophaga agilis]MDJ1499836.1 tRNA (N6-isopentenyl adenosine(37)-C2)-methylthiotransferase MiaB [Xanthocytophaga agilis]
MERVVQQLEILTETDKEACEMPRISKEENRGNSRKMYIESYGCQMNFADSEIVTSILQEQGFDTTSDFNNADVIFLNTCAIRENAEQKVRNRLKHLTNVKKNRPGTLIGVLGCMAERLKSKFLEEERIVDMVVGPDAYRDLPRLVEEADGGQKAVNVFLSREETYADISPVRLNSNGVTAFISIMRGCDNMCSFCVVPFTRGRERSRDPYSIVAEARDLFAQGYRDVTLLGQNVDSYKWKASEESKETCNFAQLLEQVALIHPDLRVRFTTSHPKDFTDEVLHTMAKYENICKYIHLPAQSGNSRVLQLMNRTYDREWYLDRIAAIRRILGEECGISTDMIAGFCSETEEEHQDSLSLMEIVKYDFAYMFTYSERPNTPAAKKLADDISPEVKNRRLNEIIEMQQKSSLERNKLDLGKVHKVLVEGTSKRSEDHLQGRTSANKVVVFPKKHYKKGDYVNVFVNDCTNATLLGEAID